MRLYATVWAEITDEDWERIQALPSFDDRQLALVAWLTHGAELRHFEHMTVTTDDSDPFVWAEGREEKP